MINHFDKFVKGIMKDGKLESSLIRVNIAMDILTNKLSCTREDIFDAMIKNCYCNFKMIPTRRGRYIYKIPKEINELQSHKLLIKEITKSIKFVPNKKTGQLTTKRTGSSLINRIVSELELIFKKPSESITIKRINDKKKLAYENRAFVR